MAQFRAEIRGQRGEASRLGSAKSGIKATVNGWNSGVRVEAQTSASGDDFFYIYATSGSNGYHSESIGVVIRDETGKVTFIPKG